MSNEVYLTRTGSFLPLESVGNDEIEQVLGMVGGSTGVFVALLAAVALAVFEVMMVLRDPNGLRYGDKLAGTKVLD